jgi:hypothetical protein
MSLPRFFTTTCRNAAHLLSHPLVPLFAAIAAILITFSSVKTGLWADDELHAAMLTPHNAFKDAGRVPADSHLFKNAVMSLYRWTGTGKMRESLKRTFPWWGDIEMKQNFWRPLASASLWLDYKLWPQNTALMHLENILWFAFSVFLAAIWFRKFIHGWAAGVAIILFVSNPEFPATVAWIAARYAIITMAFGVSAILCHHAWRFSGNKLAAAASWVLLVLALLSGEGGVAAAGYILAYGLFYEKSNLRFRLRSIIPAALIVLTWQAAYKFMGYGAHFSVVYVDPGAEPMRYLVNLIKNGPILLLNITGQLPNGHLMAMSPGLQKMIWIGAVVQWVIIFGVFWPMLRNDRRAAFFLTGALLSLIPAASSVFINERSLLFIGLGGMGLAALAIEASVNGAPWLDGRRLRRMVVAAASLALVALHMAHPLWVLFRNHSASPGYSNEAKPGSLAINILNSAFGAGKNIVVVNTGETFGSIAHAFPHRSYARLGLPQGLGVLTATYHDISITRADSMTLVFSTPRGTLYPSGQLPKKDIRSWPRTDPYFVNAFNNSTLRTRERPMHARDSVDYFLFLAVVKEVNEQGVPSKAMFKFHRPLEDQCFAWVQWDWSKGIYRSFTPPAVGQTIFIPGRFSAVRM